MADQGRKFCGILYPDAENYVCDDVLEVIKSYFDSWAYVLHDKDILEESGELKKAHYHWVGSLTNPVSISTIINRLDVPPQSVEYIRKRGKHDMWKGAVRYLIHDNNPEKFQYTVEEVVSNFDIRKFLSDRDDVMQIQKILKFIDENPNCTIRNILDFAVANGCYSEFKKAGFIIREVMKERRGIAV